MAISRSADAASLSRATSTLDARVPVLRAGPTQPGKVLDETVAHVVLSTGA
ncbi:hypothetical protein [Nonomuraea basaltis]|uniref:hypothetical protein n=1 Tax=Nonomuraea basaltis TaxID=2495887 RepID=UPI001486089D|nr:hypothetical protein [Nonomuraea basaltis]